MPKASIGCFGSANRVSLLYFRSALSVLDKADLYFFSGTNPAPVLYDAVLWAAENNITKDTDAVHFSPDMGTIRAQVVTFIYRWMAK